MKVALVHDWLVTWRGGEKCLESLLKIYPNADIYTLFSIEDITKTYLSKNKVISSIFSSLPVVERYYRFLFPFYPLAIKDLSRKLSNQHSKEPYDIVISISHCVAKNINVPEGVKHICYCLTPVRYIWDQFDNYFNSKWYRPIVSSIRNLYKKWDIRTAQKVTKFIAISEFVGIRIKNYYGRNSDVVYPPVSIDRFKPIDSSSGHEYYLMVNALVPYKRTDVVVEAFKYLKDKKLVIVGNGPELTKLKLLAGENVKILGTVADEVLEDLYANCRALIYPALEDFGIAPVEAQSSGRPVICLNEGGCAETVCLSGEKLSGMAILELTPMGIADLITKFEPLLEKGCFKAEFCRESALRFSEESFIKNINLSIIGR